MKPGWVIAIGLYWSSLAACGGGATKAAADIGVIGGLTDSGMAADDTGTSGASDAGGMPDAGQGAMITVQFTYQPGWSGATAVEVVGAFGQAMDWKQPLTTLTKDANGVFSGSADLPIGRYPYLFRIKGDDASMKANYMRYALDAGNPTFEACPQGAPTYSMQVMNPCSVVDLTLGAPTKAPLFHVKTTITYDGQPKAGYLVEIERMEMGSHHFFANRATSAADGTIDLEVAAGHYRLQVLYPTILSQSDEQRDPLTLQAARRVLSSGFAVMNDVTVSAAEVAYHSYNQMMPRTTPDTLPTQFSIAVNPGESSARLDVYGSPVGDPLFASKTSTATQIRFDGHFNAGVSKTSSVTLGKMYFWGTEQIGPRPAAGQVQWTVQSMVFPITWH